MGIRDLYWDGSVFEDAMETIIVEGTAKSGANLYAGSTEPDGTTRLNYNGYFYATRFINAVYKDYAEFFLKGEEGIEAGDVLSLSRNLEREIYVKSTEPYDSYVVGVVSDCYAHCIGGDGKDLEETEKLYAPVGLAGRVRVKVTGKVNRGDLLVSSHIKGVAMRAEKYIPGTVIGKSLGHWDGNKDEIGYVTMLIMHC